MGWYRNVSEQRRHAVSYNETGLLDFIFSAQQVLHPETKSAIIVSHCRRGMTGISSNRAHKRHTVTYI